jgi:hypothetical protein
MASIGDAAFKQPHVTAAFDVNQLDFSVRAADLVPVMGRW